MQGFRYALAKPQGHQKGQKLRPRWFAVFLFTADSKHAILTPSEVILLPKIISQEDLSSFGISPTSHFLSNQKGTCL